MARIASIGGQNAFPWKIYNASVGGEALIKVNSGDGFAGAVDGIIATLNGIPIDYSGNEPPTLGVEDGEIVYVHVTKDSSGVTQTVEILADDVLPDPDTANPPLNGYMTIGSVSVDINDSGKAVVNPANTIVDSLFSQICLGAFIWGY